LARKARTYVGDAPTEETLRPKHLTKQDFGRRLYKLMIARGWNQSELGRQSNLSRDSISTYVRGLAFPERLNLEKLAAAFGMKAEDLLPNMLESSLDDDIPSLELKVSTVDSSVAWLRVNRKVSTSTAMKIIDVLNADETPDGE
jgi:transcriptional regulator with XRE-family HTH domain